MTKRPVRTPAQQRAWRHNASLGSTIWASKAMQGIAGTQTLTPAARKQVSVVIYELAKLRGLLATRVDPSAEPKETLK